MRPPVDADRIRALAAFLAERTTADVTIYVTGGATAVLEGWRASTIDVDLRVEPDDDDLLRALVIAKRELDINVELVSPSDFVPELPGWRDRSPFVLRDRDVTVRHMDFYSQALAKISRGINSDADDVRAMLRNGLIERDRARELFRDAVELLFRYPALDADDLRAKIDRALGAGTEPL
jgi:hypothetical protein